MSVQQTFETRSIVRAVKLEPNIDNVVSLIRQSSKQDLEACCPSTGSSLIVYTVQRKDDTEALSLCKLLCDELCVCDPLHLDCNRQSALFFAARDGNEKCVSYLLQKGCQPDQRDSASQTALFYAARDGRINTIKILLDYGANINSVDHLGQTALFYASRDGRLDTVNFMLEKGANIWVRDRHRRTAIYYAQRNNHKELVNALKTAAGGGNVLLSPNTLDKTETSLLASSNIIHTEDTETRGTFKRSRSGSPKNIAKVSKTFHSNDSQKSVNRRLYRLSIRGPLEDEANDSLTWLSAPIEKIELFEKLVPSIAVWSHSSQSSVKNILEDIRAGWQPLAVNILEKLSQMDGGWIFSKPVDCKAWGCPDYYDVILKPMDFTTMKKKFRNRCYERCSEFVADIHLVFSNCFCYNKPDSHVVSIAKNVESTFKELQVSYELEKWIKREILVEDWYNIANQLKNNVAEV